MFIYLKCIYLRSIELFREKYAFLFLLDRIRIEREKSNTISRMKENNIVLCIDGRMEIKTKKIEYTYWSLTCKEMGECNNIEMKDKRNNYHDLIVFH